MNIAMVVGGGGFQGLPVLRSLHAIGWRAIVADSVTESLNQFEADVFHPMPEAKYNEAFRAEMLMVSQRYGVKAIFPTTMYDLPVLAELRPELESRGVHVFASSPELVTLLSDKMQTMSVSRKAGLLVLPTVDPDCHDFSYPLVGKPRQGWGGLGIVKVATSKEWLESAQKKFAASYLWQRKLAQFVEWSVDFAIGYEGDCSPMVCRRRLRTSGGFAVLSDVAESPRVENLARRTASWLIEMGGCGLFNIQILEEPDGSLWLSDLNPRPGTSSTCTLSVGINLVEFLLTSKLVRNNSRHGIVIRTLSEHFLPKLARQINGVVFDLDETLICQKSWMQAKLEKMLIEFPEPVEPTQLICFRLEASRIIDEGPWHQLIDIALERSGLPSSLSEKLIYLWRTISPENIVIHQDALAFIRALQTRNIPIALLSDNPAASQYQKITLLPCDIHFKSIILTDTLSAPKPDPKGFLVAAESLSLSPKNLLMIGDSPWRDGVGALRAGYASALIIQRCGSMTNSLRSLFEQEYPDVADRISWIDSLFGADRILEFSA